MFVAVVAVAQVVNKTETVGFVTSSRIDTVRALPLVSQMVVMVKREANRTGGVRPRVMLVKTARMS